MAISYANIGDANAYGLNHFEVAPRWVEKAADLDADNAYFAASLAELYWELGDAVESARWLSRALAIDDEHPTANAIAAVLYLHRGQMDEARRQALKVGELDPRVTFLARDHDLRAKDYATARARYAKMVPRLLSTELPERLTNSEAFAAVDLAVVLQHTGESERAMALLDRSEVYMRTIPHLGSQGSCYSDARIEALRGNKSKALAALREAERVGCRGLWPYYRDSDPALASIRNEPEFKAVFADIERDMARQRAALAARPKDAPLDLASTGT